ncbi:MAG: transposase [Gemmatimonadota bacterium]|nr:MAG: transposase [Gemmatimonadota bacterium]
MGSDSKNASTWNTAQRVVYKAEHTAQGATVRFIVTYLNDASSIRQHTVDEGRWN